MKRSPIISTSYIIMLAFICVTFIACDDDGRHQPITVKKTDNGGDGSGKTEAVTFQEIKPLLEQNCKECHASFTDESAFKTSVLSGEVTKRIWDKKDDPDISMPRGLEMSLENRELIRNYALGVLNPTTGNSADGSDNNNNGNGQAGTPAPAPKDPLTETRQFQLVKSCTSCHGVEGISTMPGVPSLAGMKPQYFRDQIEAFQQVKIVDGIQVAEKKEGSTQEPRKDLNKTHSYKMNQIVQDLDQQDIDHLITFFSMNDMSGDKDYDTYENPMKANFAVCAGCHVGNNSGAGPQIRGQNAEYMANQLRAFKSSERKGMMNSFALGINDDIIDDLAKYISELKKVK